MSAHSILAQVGDGDINLPDDAGSTIVFVLFLAVLGGLWWVMRTTRRRAEQQFWERKRAERDHDEDR